MQFPDQTPFPYQTPLARTLQFSCESSLSSEACLTAFNQSDQSPTVLTCGHSICAKCLKILTAGRGMCPTCRTNPIQESYSGTSNNFESLLDVTDILPETDDEVCRRHNKPYQAFCSTE